MNRVGVLLPLFFEFYFFAFGDGDYFKHNQGVTYACVRPHTCGHSVTTYNRSNEIRYDVFANVFIKNYIVPPTD